MTALTIQTRRGDRSTAHERMLEFYRRHTPVTDPGAHAETLRRLPRDVASLVEIIGGVFAHYEFDVAGTGYTPTPQRLSDVDLRTASAMLERLASGPPLERARSIEERLLGVCRDASLLVCSALRTHGIPARLRYGTARHLYVPTRPMHDHVVVEYWSESDGVWKYGDGRMYRSVREEHRLPDYVRDNVPQDMFLTGSQAWRYSKESDRAAKLLSGAMFSADAGRWQARNLFLYDLASLAGWEPLMWDAWGYIRRSRRQATPRGPVQHYKLDRLAALDPREPSQWHRLLREYRWMRLVRVPGRILSCSPVNGRQPVAAPAMWRHEHARH